MNKNPYGFKVSILAWADIASENAAKAESRMRRFVNNVIECAEELGLSVTVGEIKFGLIDAESASPSVKTPHNEAVNESAITSAQQDDSDTV